MPNFGDNPSFAARSFSNQLQVAASIKHESLALSAKQERNNIGTPT